MQKKRFTRERCIKKRVEISAILSHGERKKTKYFIIFSVINELHYDRLAIIVTKKLGSSVVRNKIKRVIREIVRNTTVSRQPCFNIVIAPNKNSITDYRECKENYETWRKNKEILC